MAAFKGAFSETIRNARALSPSDLERERAMRSERFGSSVDAETVISTR